MPFMTTPELLCQRRFTQENIRHLQAIMPNLPLDNRERAAGTIRNLHGQLEHINAELAMATAG